MNLLQRAWLSMFGKKSYDFTTPQAWQSIINPGSTAGVTVTPSSSLEFSAVYSAVKLISEQLASMPLNIYRSTPEGKEKATKHDQFYLLKNAPHDLYTSFTFRKTLFMYFLLWGNGYAEIIRNGNGRPVQYKLIEPWKIEPQLDEHTGKLYYKDTTDGRMIYPANMIHIMDMSFDGVTGKSRITQARESIGEGLAQQQLGNKFFSKGTVLGGIIRTPHRLTPEQAKAFKDTWDKGYGSIDKGGATGILDQGMEYVPFKMSMPLNDAQWLENKKFKVADIARIFNLHPFLLSSDETPYNHADQANIDLVQKCLLPIAILFEQELNRKVFTEIEKGTFHVKLEHKGLLRGDITAQTEHIRVMVSMGIYSINDGRKFLDMNPVDGGDLRTVQINQIPIEKMDDYADSITKSNENANPTE